MIIINWRGCEWTNNPLFSILKLFYFSTHWHSFQVVVFLPLCFDDVQYDLCLTSLPWFFQALCKITRHSPAAFQNVIDKVGLPALLSCLGSGVSRVQQHMLTMLATTLASGVHSQRLLQDKVRTATHTTFLLFHVLLKVRTATYNILALLPASAHLTCQSERLYKGLTPWSLWHRHRSREKFAQFCLESQIQSLHHITTLHDNSVARKTIKAFPSD